LAVAIYEGRHGQLEAEEEYEDYEGAEEEYDYDDSEASEEESEE
jgi:small subunit ribosomal protein S2